MKIAGIVNEVSVEFHDELNPALWHNDEIKLEVQVKLLEIAKRFIEFLKVPDINLVDIYFMGSNAAYVYTHFSDIDLHVIVDDPNDRYKELYDAKKRLWNDQHDISIKGFDVELYVQDIKEPNASMGIYSLLKNKWIKQPEKVEADIDDASVQQKFKYLAKMINIGIRKQNLDYLNKVASKIKDLRKSGLQRAGEFSVENLAFKELRNGGYLEKLSNARQELEDAEMSLDETLNQDNGSELGISELMELQGAIENLQSEIDSQSIIAGEENDQSTYKKLEKDYRALEAISNVTENNKRAIKNNLLDNNIFLYLGDYDSIESGIAGIHVSVANGLAHVRWLGSYGKSGKLLLINALERAKSMGATKVKVEAKWESEGFYSKMGFNQDPEHKDSDPLTKALTGGTKLMSKELNELDDRAQRLRTRSRIRKGIGTKHVYRYEANVLYEIKRLAQQRSLRSLTSLANKIWAKYYTGKRKVPTIRFGKGDNSLGYPLSYTEGYSLIELAPGQQDLLTLIHELVHAIGPSLHGPSFTKVYYNILKDYLPDSVKKEVYDELVLRHGHKLKPYYRKMMAEDYQPQVSKEQLRLIAQYADKLFRAAGLDVIFTKHFQDRVNDPRNENPIKPREILDVFNKAYKQLDQGKEIARLGPEAQAVLKDMEKDLNMPFVLKWHDATQELDLVFKTVMRKRNFMTSNPTLKVETNDNN